MKKFIIPMLLLFACVTSLPAQITREQADAIVLQHIENEITPPYLLLVNVNAPSEDGIILTTFQEEMIKVKYPCWAYYLNENPDIQEPAQHRYLFVKKDDGNLLEVITNNDLAPDDLTQWMPLNVGIVDLCENGISVYPNPTTGQLRIENGELRIDKVEVFDVYGKLLLTFNFQLSTDKIDISNLQTGVYFAKITTETGILNKKIVKL